MAAFVIYLFIGLLFVGWGIYVSRSNTPKPFGFWANAEPFEVNDVKLYNHALGKLFAGYGIALALLGIPLLGGQNTAGPIITILGTMLSSIIMMVIYVVVIEPKYRKK